LKASFSWSLQSSAIQHLLLLPICSFVLWSRQAHMILRCLCFAKTALGWMMLLVDSVRSCTPRIKTMDESAFNKLLALLALKSLLKSLGNWYWANNSSSLRRQSSSTTGASLLEYWRLYWSRTMLDFGNLSSKTAQHNRNYSLSRCWNSIPIQRVSSGKN